MNKSKQEEALLYSCYVCGENLPEARMKPEKFQLQDLNASANVCEDHSEYFFIKPDPPLPIDPESQMVALERQLQSRGLNPVETAFHLKRGVLVQGVGIVSFSIKGAQPRRQVVMPFYKKICPKCGKKGSGPYKRRGTGGEYLYFAHYGGMNGDTTKIKWCYLSSARKNGSVAART